MSHIALSSHTKLFCCCRTGLLILWANKGVLMLQEVWSNYSNSPSYAINDFRLRGEQ